MTEQNEKKAVLEALIFVADKPLTNNEIKEVLEGITESEIDDLINTLNTEYADTGRSFRIAAIAGGYQMATEPEFGPWLKKLYKAQLKEKLSMPALETLAIIAYKQPATRAEIEAIRGVNADGVTRNLLEKGLIRISGRKDAPGRPLLYSTTPEFLEHFGLGAISDLPEAPQISPEDLAQAQEAQISDEQIPQEAAENESDTATPEDQPDRQEDSVPAESAGEGQQTDRQA